MKLSIKNPNTNEVHEVKPFDSYMTCEMDLIKEIMSLCIEKNETTKHDVFFDFSGHLKCLSVVYYENVSRYISNQIYILNDCNIADHKKLQQAINELQELV